jgi:signal transduction histidine kinase
VLDELDKDRELQKNEPNEPWNIVNGPIRNFLFEALELKTTQIQLEIGRDGDLLFTKLNDRGTLIYELIENNPYKGILFDIQINLFHMNRSAKIAFTKRMGLPQVQYGSVFLYKNGFRVHPYGNADNDALGLDRKKQQGFFRNLGSRELSGRIEINGRNTEFQETSSRDGGLIQNEAFDALMGLFFEYALKRLANFVINLTKFGIQGEFPDLLNPDSVEQRQLTFDLIAKLTQSKDVVLINYNKDVLNILENRSAESVTSLLKNLERIAAKQENDELDKEIKRAKTQVAVLAQSKEEAEAETVKERARAEKAEEKAREADTKIQEAEETVRQAQENIKGVSTQNLFLKSVLSNDLKHVLELHHTIGQDARTIEQFAANLLSNIRDESKPLKREILQATLERISYAAKKISTTSRFATRANFRADAEEIKADLISYVKEYLLNVYGGFVLDPYQNRVEIEFLFPAEEKFETEFTPINVSIVLDNLISNSRKHKSKNITVSVIEHSKDSLVVSFKDDGKGISQKSIPFLFQIGFTTTDGSGLGLHHAKEVMEEMNGSIAYNENSENGAEFFLTFNKPRGHK